jgi:hypothetical protein
MRSFLLRIAVSAIAVVPLSAQMHKVAKPQQVVRAIGVYEWTGDFAKPTASRLIPVSLFIEGHFEDAGVYVARPIPFALLTGNVYELQEAGIDKGMLDLAYARHLQATDAAGDTAYDDGWFGYGSVKPLAAPRAAKPLRASKTLPVLNSTKPNTTATASTTPANTDPDRPTMQRRNPDSTTTTSTAPNTTSSTTSSTTTPADDPDRPTMKRRDPSTTTTDTSTSSTPSTTPSTTDDPDRPTMQHRTSTTDTASTTPTSPAPADDPDRPTLKRHSAEDAKKASTSDLAYNSDNLNNDPDRPNLHHGKPTSAMTETELPRLTGRPSNLHQMVAVSDAVNRDPHPFTLAWDDPTQRAAILEKMQILARAQLAAYAKPTAAAQPPKPAPKPTTTHKATTKAPTQPAVALVDEDLKAYTLSYGGDPTYIYSARTDGTGTALRYVTIVAQSDSIGQLKPAIQNVTDAAHLDRTPAMQFVDVVDAEASNRASLLFELRSQNARQFALYRVIASHADQIFTTGTTQ